MDILRLFSAIKTAEQAVDYLETVRWQGRPVCPYCESTIVGRHASADRAAQRWQCRACNRAFAATVGTLFHRTHVPLHQWFRVIALALRPEAPASAYQIAEYLDMRRPTVTTMMQRLRDALTEPQQAKLIYAIIGAEQNNRNHKAQSKRRRVSA